MNRKEKKVYKALDRALGFMDKALDSASPEERHEMFMRFMDIISAAGGGTTARMHKVHMDRVRAVGTQAEKDRRTTQYEW